MIFGRFGDALCRSNMRRIVRFATNVRGVVAISVSVGELGRSPDSGIDEEIVSSFRQSVDLSKFNGVSIRGCSAAASCFETIRAALEFTGARTYRRTAPPPPSEVSESISEVSEEISSELSDSLSDLD